MRIAVIGSGISGMVSAYLLSQDHDIVLYEANDYIGGLPTPLMCPSRVFPIRWIPVLSYSMKKPTRILLN